MRAELLFATSGLSYVEVLIRAGTAADVPQIKSLLESDGLPVSDLQSAQPHFLVAQSAAQIVGAGALQWFGRTALLRSLAVAASCRRNGVGRDLVAALEKTTQAVDVEELILLTLSAKVFFARIGYHVIDRQAVPDEVKEGEEFRSLCPASAICMSKLLATRHD